MIPGEEGAQSRRKNSVWKRPSLWWLGVAFLVVLLKGLLFLAFPPGWLSPVELRVDVRLEKDTSTQRKDELYLQVYEDTGDGMSEEESRRIPVVASGEYERARIVLPSRSWEKIRLDGPAQAGLFSIRSVTIISDDGESVWEGESLREVLVPSEQVAEIGSDGAGGLLYRATGSDPQFSFLVECPAPPLPNFRQLGRLIFPLGCTFLALTLFGWAVIYLLTIWREMHGSTGVLSGYRSILIGLGIVLVIGTYLLFGAQAERKPVPQHMAGHNLYFHLTESYLHGKLALLEQPVGPLLTLDNPFDPVENARLRLHDASFYDNRYYVYFGPAPVVALYLPWRVITGTDLPDRWADAFLLSGAFIFLFFTFLRVRSTLPKRSNFGSLTQAFLGLAFTTGALYLMSRSVVYEVALSSALFWMAAAIFLLFEGLRSKAPIRLVGFAGVALGMAMASRHSFVLVSAFSVGTVFVYLLASGEFRWKGLQKCIALTVPAALFGVLLLAHNQARFDDPIEFGHNFQIGVVDPHQVKFLDPDNLAYNSVINLFQPPAVYPPFPWIHLKGQELLDWVSAPDGHIRVEGGIGLFLANPYLVLLPFLGPLSSFRRAHARVRWLLFTVGGIALINFLVIGLFSYSSARYALDFVPWLVLFFALCWASFGAGEKGTLKRKILVILLIPMMGWSIYLHFGLALLRFL